MDDKNLKRRRGTTAAETGSPHLILAPTEISHIDHRLLLLGCHTPGHLVERLKKDKRQLENLVDRLGSPAARTMPRPNDSPDVAASKTLAYILRHGAEKEMLDMRSDGYLKLNDVVRHARSTCWTVICTAVRLR